jgi:glycosyltransferase involved in cell wall biosynthesis
MSNPRIVLFRPSHKPLIRDRKLILSFKSLGADVTFVGNRRNTTDVASGSTGPEGHQVIHKGFSYPYYSKLMPIGTLWYGMAAGLTSVAKNADVLVALDFEGLLPSSLCSMVRSGKKKIIYDIADTFSARYQTLKILASTIQYVDDLLMSRCEMVIVPQENRIHNHVYRKPKNWCMIPNTPLQSEAPPLVPFDAKPPYTLLLSGQMMWSRGIKEFVTAAEIAGNIKIKVVTGKFPEGVEPFLRSKPFVEIFPEMEQKEVLKVATQCHLIGAYYDPSRKINRQAAPNKVFDALAAGRPIIVNSEIETADYITKELKAGYSFPYSDTDALAAFFKSLPSRSDELERISRENWQKFQDQWAWEKLATPILKKLIS